MKTQFSLHLIRLMLFCSAAVLTLSTGTSAFAQSKHNKSRPLTLPTIFVEADLLTPPDDVTPDEVIALPDGTVLSLPVFTSAGSTTLPDGSILTLARNTSDGSIILPDGTTATRNSDGTLTLADGTVVNPSAQDARPANRG